MNLDSTAALVARMNLDSPAMLTAFLAGLALGLFLVVGFEALRGLAAQRRSERDSRYRVRRRRPTDADG